MMNRTLAMLAVALGAGIAIGALLISQVQRPPAGAGIGDVGAGSAATLERIARLERALDDEAEARRALQDRLAMLEAAAGGLPTEPPAGLNEAPNGRPERGGRTERDERDVAAMARNFAERRVAMLVENGFTEDEARRILRLESEAQFMALRQEWESQFGDSAQDPSAAFASAQSIFRERLGDDAYARYLEAQGQPTDVQILQVQEGSPAGAAGLQAGDHIVTYNGERVFNVIDLRQMTMQSRPGEAAVIEIDRDGARMQITIPSGPIGITGNAPPYMGRTWAPRN
ncbi:MAG TPA: PDZ domain-containing protein [Woeseiaceae bacterium]